MKTRPTSYWTFFCNPARWQIDEFLASQQEEDHYRITRWQSTWFSPGQLGVVRVGVDERTRAQLAGKERLVPGIYAIVQVMGMPRSGTRLGRPLLVGAAGRGQRPLGGGNQVSEEPVALPSAAVTPEVRPAGG